MALVRLARFGKSSETHLARLALERAGIPVELRGEARSTLTGEVPFEDAGGELWVEESDVSRAAGVLVEAERPGEDTGPELECPACQAQNPAGFNLCWKCQAPLDPTRKAPAPAEPAAPTSPSPGAGDGAAAPSAKRRPTVSSVLIAALLCVVAVLGARLARGQPAAKAEKSALWTYSWDAEGCLVEAQLSGTVHAVYCDADGNGIYERGQHYDARGRLASITFDSNENGRIERIDEYSPAGTRVSMSVDRDESGRSWERREFDGPAQLTYTDVDGDGLDDRLELRVDGGLKLVQLRTAEGWQTQP